MLAGVWFVNVQVIAAARRFESGVTHVPLAISTNLDNLRNQASTLKTRSCCVHLRQEFGIRTDRLQLVLPQAA